MYESKNEPLLGMRHFTRRMLLHVGYALLLIAVTLCVGVAGHVWWFEPVGLHDAVLNTALVLAGIGPYIMPETAGGKVFFAVFGIFVGLIFMATLGLVLAPLAHRLIHKFHLDEDDC